MNNPTSDQYRSLYAVSDNPEPTSRFDTQQALLACLLTLGPTAWYATAGNVSAEMFDGERREIFEAIENLNQRGEVADVITVASEIDSDSLAQHELGDLIALTGKLHISARELKTYTRHIQRQFKDRKARDIGAKLADTGDLDQARVDLLDLDTDTASETVDAQTAITEWQDDQARREEGVSSGIRTHLKALDRILLEIEPDDLVVIAGRPSMGKTTLALNIAQRCGTPTGVFSLEMSRKQLVGKMIASHGVDAAKLRQPKLRTDSENATITRAQKFIIESGIRINDKAGISLQEIDAKARRWVNAHGVGLIIVDYLQLATCKAESRLEEVSAISRGLKRIAKDLHVPVIAVSQLNREVDKRGSGVPRLSDLRESGQLEQDADIVIFVYRQEVYVEGSRPGEADLIVAKHREGETGIAHVGWQGQYQRFVDLAPDGFRRSE